MKLIDDYPVDAVAVLPLVAATSDSIATSISRYRFPHTFLTSTPPYTLVFPPLEDPRPSQRTKAGVRMDEWR